MKLSWTKDLKAESDLARMAVVFSVQDIPLSAIDFAESQVNGARLGDPIVRHLVDDYKQGMENGDSFPMPVTVAAKGKGRFVVLSGIQRTTAIKEMVESGDVAKTITIPCYVIDTADKLLHEIIARSGNVAHGGRSDRAERLAHAIYCVRSLGLTTEQAARVFMVSRTTITGHIRADKERETLSDAGIDAASIPDSSLDQLRLIPDRSTKVKLGYLIAKHVPSTERVKQIVNTMKRDDTPLGRLNRVRQFEKELTLQAHATSTPRNGKSPKVPQRPRRDTLLRMLDRLDSFLEAGPMGRPFLSLSEMQFSGGEDTKRVKHLWGNVRMRLDIAIKADR
jgi:hypothetical protein